MINQGTDLVVSAASAWEITTKFRLGKLDQAQAVHLPGDADKAIISFPAGLRVVW